MTDAQSATTDVAAQGTPSKTESPAAKWQARIATCEAHRAKLISDWKENVAYRVMQPFPATPEGGDTVDRVALTEDWARTKSKTAELAFSLPKIYAQASRQEFQKSAPVVTALVNKKLRQIGGEYVLDECLADVINASGLMAAVLAMDTRFEDVEIDQKDPTTGQTLVGPDGVTPLKEKVRRPIWRQPTLSRLSPADLLWPAEFRSSDWSKARWLGYQLDMTETRVRATWGRKIPIEWKCGEENRPADTMADAVKTDQAKGGGTKTARVSYVFYYAAEYDADKIHPHCIRYHVFVDGIDDPVESGDCPDQVWVPEQPALPEGPNGPGSAAIPGHYEGLTRLPIIVGTLVYVSDLAEPPSDSQVGRSGVRELMRSRSQMIRQRDLSAPIRWYDTNRVEETTIDSIRAGRWQDIIPVNGDGSRVFGEVARAAYPRENFSFDSVIRQGLDQAWSLSNVQMGLPNDETKSATEVSSVDSSARKRSDYERNRVRRFVVSIGEVLFSLMQRYETYDDWVQVVGPEGADIWQQVKPLDMKGMYEFDFVADTTDGIDLQTKQANSQKVYNLAANSPTANRRYLEAEFFRLHGIDPERAQLPPADPVPEKPNFSYRYSGEDLTNPIVVALLLKYEEITPKDIEAAAMLIKDSVKKMQVTDASVVPPGRQLADVPKKPGERGPDVEPPEVVEPILKRAADGTHL